MRTILMTMLMLPLGCTIGGCALSLPPGGFGNDNAAPGEPSDADDVLLDPAGGDVGRPIGETDGTVADGDVIAGDPVPDDSGAPPDDESTTTPPPDGDDTEMPLPDDVPLPPDNVQSGTLTAGSFDDNLNYDVYQSFIAQLLQNDAAEQLPALNLGRRVVITVRNDAGQPVGDARVTVIGASANDQQAQAALDTTTGSDGRVLFLTNLDGAGDESEFLLTITPPDGSDPLTVMANAADAAWDITLPAVASTTPSRLDLAFVVDATGSMADELEFLKIEIDAIASGIQSAFPNVAQRFALIVYRDFGDDYVTRVFDFTASLGDFQNDLSAQFASGGGDYPEAMHVAVEDAAALSWTETGTARMMFLIADAPPHVEFGERTMEGIADLRDAGVAIYPVAASGVADEAEFFMRTAAFVTLSRYLFLTDDSGVGNAHAEPRVPCYHVQRLDRLMIDMITAELNGTQTNPDPATIIRTVGHPVDGVCTAAPSDFQPDNGSEPQAP
ncbi:MAG: VWA domain-containing protein [Phycisphaerales bacterium]|nr:VWA domain-containing protein [Phycisphaerales bacterium]